MGNSQLNLTQRPALIRLGASRVGFRPFPRFNREQPVDVALVAGGWPGRWLDEAPNKLET
jgi:hypothetical protein